MKRLFALPAALVTGAGLVGALAFAARPSAPGPAGHGDPSLPAEAGSVDERLRGLRAFEAERRSAADFERLRDSSEAFGPDPYDVEALPGSDWFVAILRGRSALVLLDRDGRELSRVTAPRSPTGLAVDARDIYVSGELEPRIANYRVVSDRLELSGNVALGVPGARDVAASSGTLHVVEPRHGRLITLPSAAARRAGVAPSEIVVGGGAFRVRRIGGFVLVACLTDHSVVAYRIGSDGRPDPASRAAIVNDGPIWSFDALEDGSGLLVASGGVEDHPLDRRIGSFGYIDSFVFLDRLQPGEAPQRLAAIDVSDHGVVTPKALRLERGPSAALSIEVTGYGSARRVRLSFGAGLGAEPTALARSARPGTNAFVATPDGGEISANPLLDGFVVERAGQARFVPVADAAPVRSEQSRIGEALVFTTLMAPSNRSAGALSRFSCETCHFEGGVDGRTHHTGRGEIRATTRPLLGLFNARPYFSRALDPDLAKMAHNEFRVAGAGSQTDPWFSIQTAEHRWLGEAGVAAARIEPEELRRSLMAFLMDLTPRPNPAAAGRARFDEAERAGRDVFAKRCERCHAARLSSDVESSLVPLERWEPLIMSANAPIVWARAERFATGVEPYVHPGGARVPSLRRLHGKRPYFTNGSAAALEAVLERARFDDLRFFHAGAPTDARLVKLGPDEQRALLAFLELL